MKLLIMTALLVAGDQISKWLALQYFSSPVDVWPGILQFAAVKNTGVAFGIAIPNAVMIFAAPLLLALLVWLVTRECKMGHPATRTALALIIAGGIGNFADRLGKGAVTDFIAFSFWPSFNLADSYLTVGVALLLVFHAKITS